MKGEVVPFPKQCTCHLCRPLCVVPATKNCNIVYETRLVGHCVEEQEFLNAHGH
jgi:hypothetical protein